MASPDVPTLYHVPYFSSSMPYNVALELSIPESELAVKQISAVDLRKGSEILKVSPRRVVPAVAFPDGSSMVEGGAIVMHLLEEYDKQGTLHPLPGQPDRRRFLQGVFFVVSECYKAAMEVFFVCYQIEPKDRDVEKLKVASEKFRDVVIAHLHRELKHGEREYYLGEEFSAADIMFSYPLMTVEYCDVGLLDDEVVKPYLERLKKRPAYAKLYMSS